MKILILCSNYEPGGAQRAAIRLNRQLAKQDGFSSELVFFHPKSPLFAEDTPKLICEQRINSPKAFLDFLLKLDRKMKQAKPDVVLTLLPFANIIGQLVALRHRVPKRVASHRNISDKELVGLQKIVDRSWARWGIYTHITAVSESTKNSFSYYGEKAFRKIAVVNNGLNFVPSTKSKETCREKFGLPQNELIVGNIGRMVKQKNQQLLIHILPSLKDIVLVIIGKGELESSLKNLADELGVSKRLKIIPELNANDIPDFYKAIDIFAMPSLFEGLSNALIEALAAGLPIVSSDVDSQKDVLIRVDGLKAGVLAPTSDLAKWVNSIQRIKANPTLRSQLENCALARAKDFSIEQMTTGFIKSFQ